MAKEDCIEMQGTILETLPNTMFSALSHVHFFVPCLCRLVANLRQRLINP